jgi:hypothetical protein
MKRFNMNNFTSHAWTGILLSIRSNYYIGFPELNYYISPFTMTEIINRAL